VLLALAVLGETGVLAFRRVGHWLVVADPLAHARAIVVLTGDHPFRALEGAALHRGGWAPEVWLQRSSAPARDAALRRLGFEATGEEARNRALLERLGVPAASIRVLAGEVRNTREEVEAVWRELARTGGTSVLLVTSKPHSRRLRATWRAVAGDSPRATVRYARDDPFEPGAWWRSTGDALAVSREVLGLLNLWAGFPVRPGGS
jgi:uncharacterized SAM-binding protein YcdF (DUF218 family)